jgi:hypothetical protein
VTSVNGSINGSEHPEFLGAYVMGLVDDADERALIEAHLATCETCRAEVAELTGLRGVLDAVPRQSVLDDLAALDAADAPAPPGTDDLLLRRTLKEVRDESRSSRRLRALGVAAGIVVVAAAAGIGGHLVAKEIYVEAPPAAVQEPAEVVTATDAATGVALTARITPAGTWTRLNVSVTGVPVGTYCQIVAVADDGHRDVAGSWLIGTPRPGKPRRGVDGSTAIAPEDLSSVEIVDGTGKRLVSVSA